MMFTSPVATLPYVRAGRLRALATTGSTRFAALPDLPTIEESGFPGYEASLWYGILAPAGTPSEVIATLNRAILDALRHGDIKERFASLGVGIVGSTPQAFADHLVAEIRKWTKVIKDAGIRPG